MDTSRPRTPPAPVSAGPPKAARTAYRGTQETRKRQSNFKRGQQGCSCANRTSVSGSGEESLNSELSVKSTTTEPTPPNGGRPTCTFYLSPVPASSCLVLKLSTFSPFVSKSKFIQGIVSRWGIGGSGSLHGKFCPRFPRP